MRLGPDLRSFLPAADKLCTPVTANSAKFLIRCPALDATPNCRIRAYAVFSRVNIYLIGIFAISGFVC